jgi:2-desacetyl-2-hydroxyethyl bacteriochlorophyllide A dehydrogenase
MLAAFCTGKGQIEVRDAPDPTPGRGEVMVRVRTCGICGSDLHFYRGAFPAMPNTPAGHEFAGEVVEVGPGIQGFSPGDRVAVEPIRSCQTCAYCRTGNYHICPSRALLGTFTPGGLAELVSVPAYSLYSLPEGMDWSVAALTEPLAVAVHGLHIVNLGIGERVLVLGTGTIGLLTVLAARAAGATVFATYRHHHQADAALRLGAGRVIAEGETDGLEREGIDVIVETVGGAAPTLNQAMGIVRMGGRVSVLGLFAQPLNFNAFSLMYKEITVVGGITYCRPGQQSDFDVALGILARHPEEAKGIVTHSFPLSDAGKAFETALDKSTRSLKVQVLP